VFEETYIARESGQMRKVHADTCAGS